ncbi:MAG TPA: alpha/beta hydrolase [Gammaproteobacteria bacterium]|nr:alpha/beta hydrolase [Gammaproteobacteria bacterium]
MTTEKNPALLEAIELDPNQAASASLIWLHGLGASGEDFVPLATTLQHLTQQALRFVFPHAPERPVTINQGLIMPAWYDIISFEKDGEIDHEGISISVKQVKDLIKAEHDKGFPFQKIILAGFSQGAVIALNTLLAIPEELGGVIALSGYLPPREIPSHSHQTAIFIGHGQHDEVVPCIYGQAAYETLQKAGYPVSWHTYPMTHAVCDEEIQDMARWLKNIL